jgi:hypothetical protein
MISWDREHLPEGHFILLSSRLKVPKGFDQNGIINVSVRLRVPEYLALCLKTNVQHHNLRKSALPVLDGKNYV